MTTVLTLVNNSVGRSDCLLNYFDTYSNTRLNLLNIPQRRNRNMAFCEGFFMA